MHLSRAGTGFEAIPPSTCHAVADAHRRRRYQSAWASACLPPPPPSHPRRCVPFCGCARVGVASSPLTGMKVCCCSGGVMAVFFFWPLYAPRKPFSCRWCGQGGGARGTSVGWDAVPTLSDCYALCVECVLSLVLTSIVSDAPSRRVCGCGFAPAPAGLGWGGHARPAVGVSAAAVRLFSCAAAQRGQPRDGCAKEAGNRR